MWQALLLLSLAIGANSQLSGQCTCQYSNSQCDFDGFEQYPGSCTDAITECQDCTSESLCKLRCFTNSQCYGYSWHTSYRSTQGRCGHLLVDPLEGNRGCTSQHSNNVKYFQKKCRGQGSILSDQPEFRSADANAEFDRGCPLECPPIPRVADALHNGKNTNIDSKVTYVCKKGFQLKGLRTITCLPDGTWQTPIPECELYQTKEE